MGRGMGMSVSSYITPAGIRGRFKQALKDVR